MTSESASIRLAVAETWPVFATDLSKFESCVFEQRTKKREAQTRLNEHEVSCACKRAKVLGGIKLVYLHAAAV